MAKCKPRRDTTVRGPGNVLIDPKGQNRGWKVMAFIKPALCGATLLAVLASAAALAQTSKVGVLQCNLSGGVGMIIAENQALDCVFKNQAGGPPSHYIGRLTNVGAEYRNQRSRKNGVGGRRRDQPGRPRRLGGRLRRRSGFGGGGSGAGGAVLVGGSNNAISLQPVSVSVGTGLNVSAGLGNLNLNIA